MNKELIKAGKIASEVREFSIGLIKENKKVLDAVEEIEKKIFELGGKPAFPVDLSLNSIAAHYSPDYNDNLKLKKGDLVKIDFGVHISGWVVDTAKTIEVNNDKNKKLIEASEKALEESIKVVKPGVEVCEIGKVIQEVIQSYGFSPIRNLSGHSLDRFSVHAGLSIPNYDNNNKTRLEKGQIIALEPFATTGKGKVIEGKASGVYSLIEKKPVRNLVVRKILNFIEKEYNTLPFCRRWLLKKFNLFQVNFALKDLEQNEIIKSYPILPEESNGLVSQAEHSLVVGGEILTKI